MDTRLQNLSKASSPSSSPVQTGLFQSRPSLEPEQETTDAIDSSHQPPDLQTQLDRASRFGHNFSRVQVQSHTPTVIQQQPVNGDSEEQQDEQKSDSVAERDKIMAPPVGNPIQRKSFEEEPIQMMPQLGLLTPRIQRESFEEEPIQMMPQLGLLTPRIQRESFEEEPIQMQPQLAMLQRLPQEEDESPIQMMPQLGIIQRQEAEVDEEPIQMQRIQLKVVVGQPGDKYEQEADSVAAQVMSMSVPATNSGLVQRQGEEEETPLVQRSPLADSITSLVQRHTEEQEEPIQTKSLLQRAGAKGNAGAGSDLENKLSSSKGGGSPLADDVRGFMEPRFGVDFSSVRVHTDSTAVQMNKDLGAQAFTHGSDIYFGGGKSPAISDLTAHELTHVVQQTGEVQRKSVDTSSDTISEQQTSQSQIETSDSSQNIAPLASRIVENLRVDPEDRSGQVMQLLAPLPPPVRQAVLSQAQVQLPQQQQQSLKRILARLASNRGEITESQPQEAASNREEIALSNPKQSQPETEQTVTQSQTISHNRSAGESANEATSEQSSDTSSSNPEGADRVGTNNSPSVAANAKSVGATPTKESNEQSPTSSINSPQTKTIGGRSTTAETSGNALSAQTSNNETSGSPSVQSRNGAESITPTPIGEGRGSGERGTANSHLQSPELQTLSARSQGTQALLDQVAATANNARQRFTERITQGTEAIAASIQQQQAALIAAGEQQTGAIQALFANARTQVGEIITSAQTQLQTDASSNLASLEQSHTVTLGQVATTFSSGQERVQTLGNTYAERSLQTADESAQQVQTRIQGMAQESRAIGQEKAQVGGSTPEIAQAKAKAANEIASDTATKITSGVSDAMRDLRATGPETARGFSEQSQEAARQVGAGQAEVVKQLNTSNQQTASGIQQAVNQGSQALGNLGTQLTAQLASLEQTIHNQLQTQIAQKSQEIYQAGQQAITTFQQQGQQAIASGDEHLAQFNQQLAGMDVDPELAAEVTGEIVGQVNGAYDNLIATTAGAFQQADGALTQAGTEVINAINAISTNASGQIQTFLGQAQGQVTQQVGTISGQLGTTVTEANAAGSGVVSQVATSLGRQIGQIESGFEQGLEQYRGGLEEQVASAEEQAREPRESLPGRIDEGQHRAEERARHSLLDDPLGWIGDQLSDLKDMLLDPGFWAGLLVGLALAAAVIFFVGTGGLGFLATVAIGAVIGAIAAGVGTFVSQITAGSFKNLFSGNVSLSRVNWGEIGTNMLVGAAFGAGLAAVEALGFGVMALSATAGVLTVVTNVLTGKPWDQGLLANMLLTGLFAKLMRTKAARAVIEKIANANPRNRPPASTQPNPAPEQPNPVPEQSNPVPEQPNPQRPPRDRPPRTTELPAEEVSRLVSERSDGSFRLNRKNIDNVQKIVGEPEARVAEHAAREAYAAERAANMSNVDRVFMGQEADILINSDAPPGTEMSADVVGVTRQGKYVLIESKGTEILHGLEQLEHSAQALGREQVVRYELVVAEEIRTPGFSIRNGILQLNGQPYLINGKPVHVRTTAQGR